MRFVPHFFKERIYIFYKHWKTVSVRLHQRMVSYGMWMVSYGIKVVKNNVV